MKTGLIIGGGVVGLVVVYMIAKAHAATVVGVGSPAGTGTAVVAGSSGGGTGTSLVGKLYNADKDVLTTTYHAAKSIVTLGGLL